MSDDTNEQEQKEEQKEEQKTPKRKRYQKTLKSEIVEIEGDNGEIEEYEIRELTQAEKEAWQTEMRGRIVFTKDGKPKGVENFRDYAANLLMRCVYRVSTGKRPQVGYFRDWSTTSVESLWMDAARLNGLNKTMEEAEEEGKKD